MQVSIVRGIKTLAMVVGVVAGCTLTACGVGTADSTGSRGDLLEGALTGKLGDPTANGVQDETAMAVLNFPDHRTIVTTYNDQTFQFQIKTDPTDRFLYPGATLAGWSISNNDGADWDYGGRVSPPAGWSVLWGDPSIVSSRVDQRYVFISNLAIPDSKFPTSCPDGGPPCLSGPVNNYLGGACILRSDDEGKTFTANPNDCLHVNHHFYDGGSMVAANDGAIYASFVDVDDNAVDVWKAQNATAPFVRLPRPFANFTAVVTHPRLRYDVWTDRIYVMSQANTVLVELPGGGNDGYYADVVLDWYEKDTWAGGVRVTQDSLWYPVIYFSSNPLERKLRTGPAFSFDVGNPSVNGDDTIRVAYTARRPADGRRYVGVSRCPSSPADVTSPDPGKCISTLEWGTASQTGQQWNPIVRTQLHYFQVPSDWRMTFTSTTDETDPFAVNWRYCPLAVIPTTESVNEFETPG